MLEPSLTQIIKYEQGSILTLSPTHLLIHQPTIQAIVRYTLFPPPPSPTISTLSLFFPSPANLPLPPPLYHFVTLPVMFIYSRRLCFTPYSQPPFFLPVSQCLPRLSQSGPSCTRAILLLCAVTRYSTGHTKSILFLIIFILFFYIFSGFLYRAGI